MDRPVSRHGIIPALRVRHGVVRSFLIVLLMAITRDRLSLGQDTSLDPEFTPGEKSSEGWVTHAVVCEHQARPTEIRVLLPDGFDRAKKHSVLYVLPVEAAREARYGDGLAEVKRCDLHNKHGLICVAPTFAHLPWYADHPTDKSIRQESYLVKVVVPFIDRTYSPGKTNDEQPSRWLLGFSKSGWGAWSLIARHPDLFDRAAAWDAPLNMPRFDLYGAAQVFGTQKHFESYRVLPAIQKCQALRGSLPRLVLTGYDNFRSDHETAHRQLTEWNVPHIYRDGPKLKHAWNSGWVEEAVESLVTLTETRR